MLLPVARAIEDSGGVDTAAHAGGALLAWASGRWRHRRLHGVIPFAPDWQPHPGRTPDSLWLRTPEMWQENRSDRRLLQRCHPLVNHRMLVAVPREGSASITVGPTILARPPPNLRNVGSGAVVPGRAAGHVINNRKVPHHPIHVLCTHDQSPCIHPLATTLTSWPIVLASTRLALSALLPRWARM